VLAADRWGKPVAVKVALGDQSSAGGNLDPMKVEVERDGVWYRGLLEGWRRYDDGWMSYVRYDVAVGTQHLAWVEAERVRSV
jgi:hypothetical protein